MRKRPGDPGRFRLVQYTGFTRQPVSPRQIGIRWSSSHAGVGDEAFDTQPIAAVEQQGRAAVACAQCGDEAFKLQTFRTRASDKESVGLAVRMSIQAHPPNVARLRALGVGCSSPAGNTGTYNRLRQVTDICLCPGPRMWRASSGPSGPILARKLARIVPSR